MVEIISLDPAKSTGIAYLGNDIPRTISRKYTGFGGHMDQSVFIFNRTKAFIDELVDNDPLRETHIVVENLEAFSPQQREMVGYLKIRFHEMGFKVFDYTPRDWQQIHDYYDIRINEEHIEMFGHLVAHEKDENRKIAKLKSIHLASNYLGKSNITDDEADALCMAHFHQLVLEGRLVSHKGSGKRRRAEINERKKARARERNKYAIWNKKENQFLSVNGGFTTYKKYILYVGIDDIGKTIAGLNDKNLVRVKKDKIEEKLKGI